jgi:hypothetical protein
MSSATLQRPDRAEATIVPEKSGRAAVPPVIKPVLAPVKSSLTAKLIGIITVGLLVIGYMTKQREIFVPGEGIGYKFGIFGGCAFLLLLLYPAIKRSRLFGTGTKAVFWFRWHMILGTVGPLFIFYHSNFSLGAVNSNIALFAMIAVFVSGIIGRYGYGKVHNGMYGAKHDVGTYLANANRLMQGLADDVGGSSAKITSALAQHCDRALPKSPGLLRALGNTLLMPIKTRTAKYRIMSEVNASVVANAAIHNWSKTQQKRQLTVAREHVSEFVYAVSKAAQLQLWERMFSLWHLFHVPLFFLLLVAGVIHVIAVHLY